MVHVKPFLKAHKCLYTKSKSIKCTNKKDTSDKELKHTNRNNLKTLHLIIFKIFHFYAKMLTYKIIFIQRDMTFSVQPYAKVQILPSSALFFWKWEKWYFVKSFHAFLIRNVYSIRKFIFCQCVGVIGLRKGIKVAKFQQIC